MNSARFLSLLALPLLVGCGGAGSSAQSPDDVKCPEGQTFDGEFCRVDQSVATAEQPVPPKQQEAPQPEEESATSPSQDEAAETALEEADPEPEQPMEEEPAPTKREHATPVDVTMAAQAAPLIQYMAGAHLPAGARQFGAPFAGQFAEGQILERKVQLTTGKCYTFMGAGLPPVSEVDLELFIEGADEALVKDKTNGLQAVLGSRSECFQPQKTGPYTLVLTVSQGQGVAAAQVFQK